MKTNLGLAYFFLMGIVIVLGNNGYGEVLTYPADQNSRNIFSFPLDTTHTHSAWTVFGADGSVQFSEETLQLFADAEYRAHTYPKVYSLSRVPDLLNQGKVPLALWTLINTYADSPDSTRTIAFMLAERGLKSEFYLNAFYTYAFADPETVHFSPGAGSYLENPEELEKKLQSCRTLAAYTEKFLNARSGGK